MMVAWWWSKPMKGVKFGIFKLYVNAWPDFNLYFYIRCATMKLWKVLMIFHVVRDGNDSPNFQIQDKGACLCGNTTTHVRQNDLGKRQHGRFLSAMRQLMKDVLAVGFSDTAVLGTQPGDRQPEFKTSLVTIRRSTFVFLACMSMNRWIQQIKKDIGSDNRTSTDAEDAYRFDQSKPKTLNRTGLQVDLLWLRHTAPRIELCDPRLEFPALNQLSGKRQTHLHLKATATMLMMCFQASGLV